MSGGIVAWAGMGRDLIGLSCFFSNDAKDWRGPRVCTSFDACFPEVWSDGKQWFFYASPVTPPEPKP